MTRSSCKSDQKLSHTTDICGLTTWKAWHVNKICLVLLFSISLCHFRIWPLWEWIKIAVTLLPTGGRWASACSLVTLQAVILHTARNYAVDIFTFASCSYCRCTWCWGGQTSICTKRLPSAFFQRALIQQAADIPGYNVSGSPSR